MQDSKYSYLHVNIKILHSSPTHLQVTPKQLYKLLNEKEKPNHKNKVIHQWYIYIYIWKLFVLVFMLYMETVVLVFMLYMETVCACVYVIYGNCLCLCLCYIGKLFVLVLMLIMHNS